MLSEDALILGMADDIEYVISKLPERPGTWQELADAADVNYSFVQKLGCRKASGFSKDGYAQIVKLAAYFRGLEQS